MNINTNLGVSTSGSQSNNSLLDNGTMYLKESKVAAIYRKTIYYPFINEIRKGKYQFDGDGIEIPYPFRNISWIDGCNSQFKSISSDENMRKEMGLS